MWVIIMERVYMYYTKGIEIPSDMFRIEEDRVVLRFPMPLCLNPEGHSERIYLELPCKRVLDMEDGVYVVFTCEWDGIYGFLNSMLEKMLPCWGVVEWDVDLEYTSENLVKFMDERDLHPVCL
jgi:hypothetical protein